MAYVNELDNLGYWGEGQLNWVLDQIGKGQDWWEQHGDSIIEVGTAASRLTQGLRAARPENVGVMGASYIARVKAKRLNVRQAPTTKAEILGTLGQHQVVKVLGNVSGKTWAFITEPFEGYISNKTAYLENVITVEDAGQARDKERLDKGAGQVAPGSVDPLKALTSETGSALLIGGLAIGVVLVLMSRNR